MFVDIGETNHLGTLNFFVLGITYPRKRQCIYIGFFQIFIFD